MERKTESLREIAQFHLEFPQITLGAPFEFAQSSPEFPQTPLGRIYSFAWMTWHSRVSSLVIILKYVLERPQPGLSGLQDVIFAASCKNFSMIRENFCSLRIFATFVKTHFFIQHLIFKDFEKFMRSASKIFAW